MLETPDEVDRVIADWHRQRPEIDASSIDIFGRLARLLPLHRAAVAQFHQRWNLNEAAFDVLSGLRRSGPPFRRTVGELATSSLLTPSAITLRLDNLEQAGLVRRVRGATDRRLVHAELTAEGLRRIDEVFEEYIELERDMLGSFTATEREQLAQLLRRLCESVKESTTSKAS